MISFLISEAYPWGHRYTTVQANQNITIDISTSFKVSVEWGEGDWETSSFGYGISTDGSDWTWIDIDWFEDGSGSNKRCSTDVSISVPGKYYYAYRMVTGGVTSYSFGSDSWAENIETLSATSTLIVGEVSKATGSWSSTGTWEDGTVPSGTENVAIMHDVNVINTTATCATIYIYNGSTLLIEDDGNLTTSGNITNDGNFTLESTSAGTGSIIAGGTAIGNTSVQRYIAAWSDATHGWHFISSPVASQAIRPEFVPSTPTTSEDFYKWDESALTTPWINSESSSGVWNSSFESDFIEGGGYLAAYSTNQTKTFSGVLNTTDVGKASLSYTTGNSNTGWHLLGNPYASALYWNKTTWSLTNIDATAKIWVESSASYTDIAATTGIIPAMQGFMVHVNASTGSLTIDAADRTHNTQAWYKDTEVNKIKLTAYDTEGSTAQTSTIRVVDNATTGFDSEFDSKFLPGYAPQFYSVIADGNLSTNVIPEITSALTIPLSFVKNSSNNYYIEVEGINSLEPQEMVYLTDNKINHTQLLNDNPIYEFTSEEDDFAERFILHFSPLSINDIPIDQLVKAYATEGKVEIRSSKPIDAKINIFNISGQLINTSELNNESYAILNISNYKGPAIVSVTTTNQVLSKKVIIW